MTRICVTWTTSVTVIFGGVVTGSVDDGANGSVDSPLCVIAAICRRVCSAIRGDSTGATRQLCSVFQHSPGPSTSRHFATSSSVRSAYPSEQRMVAKACVLRGRRRIRDSIEQPHGKDSPFSCESNHPLSRVSPSSDADSSRDRRCSRLICAPVRLCIPPCWDIAATVAAHASFPACRRSAGSPVGCRRCTHYRASVQMPRRALSSLPLRASR